MSPGRTPGPGQTPSPERTLSPEQTLFRAIRRGTVLVLVLELARSVPALLAAPAAGGRPWLEWTAFFVLCGVSVAVGFVSTGRRTIGRWRLPLAATVLAASVTATAGVPPAELLSGEHWSWFIVGWFLVAVLMSENRRLVVVAVLGHLVLVVAQVSLVGPVDRFQLAEFVIRGSVLTGAQLLFGVSASAVQRTARVSAERSAAQAAVRTEQEIAAGVLADQQQRTDRIAATTVPLLRGLSTGELSPHDPDVRRRSRVEAGRLRRLLAEGDQVGNPLTHELGACVELAERAGVQVDVAYRGEAPEPDVEVRRRLIEPVIEVLAGASRHARVTVDGNARELVVSALADAAHPDTEGRVGMDVGMDAGPATAPPPGRGRHVEIAYVHAPGTVWMTATWRPA